MMQERFIALGGGVDGTSPIAQMPPGRLRIGQNVEAKPGGGYRRIEGYTAYDDAVVPGEGSILGVHFYNGKCYAFRNAEGGATAVMYSSEGNGWTAEKTGLAPGGRYRLITYAFAGEFRMYGASGTHKAFEWDGTTWTDLTTGMSPDTPEHIIAHKKHLFLSFGNSVQHSALGDPTDWTPLSGASEMLKDRNITGFSTMPNGSLGIFTKNSMTLLAGNSSADWVANNLVEYGNNAGSLPDTIMQMGSAVRFVDARGIIDMGASNASSDFYDAYISNDFDELLEGQWVNATCSTVVRKKNQYRLFLNDGTGVIVVFAGGNVMLTRTRFPHIVRCVVNTEDEDGNELILFGSDNGYIYEMENGRGLGGESIDAYMETAFSDMGLKHNVKRFRRARFDTARGGKEEIIVSARFILDDGGLRRAIDDNLFFEGDGTPLGSASPLGSTLLGGLPLVEGDMEITGMARYVSFIFRTNSNNELPWEVNGISVDFLPGRKSR